MPSKSLVIPLSKITLRHARTWLMENDPEARDYWASINKKSDLIESVKDNLYDFGINEQTGSIRISTNKSQYFDEEIRLRNQFS